MMIKKGLKTFKKPALLLSASLGLWLGVSCQDDMLAERQPVITAGDEISFAVASDSAIAARSLASAPPVTHRQFLTTIGKDSLFLYTTIEENTDQPFKKSAESRAAQKTDQTLKSNSFYVDAMYRSKVNADADAQFMNGTKVEWENGAWKYSPVKYWPNNEGDYLDFFGYLKVEKEVLPIPQYTWDANNNTYTGTFSYTLPDPIENVNNDAENQPDNDAKNQPDLIYAQALNQTKQSVNGCVELNFYHALSAILFKVGSLPDDITLTNLTITLQNVKNGGTCTIAQGENGKLKFTWTHDDADTRSYSQKFTKTGGWNDDEKNGGKGKGDPISEIDDATAFMMIPQTFGEGASMKISFTYNDVSYNFDHPLVIGDEHTEWLPNTKYTYKLIIHEYVEVEIDEKFTQNTPIKENVHFTNNGLSDIYIRAAIVGYWENRSNPDNPYVIDSWTLDDKEVGKMTWGENWDDFWIPGTDGFYYYKYPIKVGDGTEKPLFTKYVLTKSAPYEGVVLTLNVVVQAVKYESNQNTLKQAWTAAPEGISTTFNN